MLLKFLFVLLLLVQFVDGALKLKLKSKGSKGLKLLREGKFLEYQKWRLNHRKELENRHGQVFAGRSKIYDYQDWTYVLNISAGTPPQNFTVVFDTAVSLSWLSDISAPQPKNDSTSWICYDKNCFKSNESSTYIKDGRVYGEDYHDQSSGFLGIDTIRLGDDKVGELVISNATFGQATAVLSDWNNREFDGVLGLAFKSVSLDSVEPIFQTAIRQKLVNKPIFNIWIEKKGSTVEDERAGLLTFGDYNQVDCGSTQYIVYIPLSHKTKYFFEIDAIQINEKQTWKKHSVVSDTSTALIWTPSKVLNDLVKVSNATYDFTNNIYKISCDTKLNFSIIHTGRTLTIDEQFTVLYSNDLDACFLAFDVWSGYGTDFVLGDPFNTAFCQTYDLSGNGQIGYSKSIDY